MADPLFSVVIPTYRRPEFLVEAVTSVTEQSVADLECIVVDDASGLPTPEFTDPRVRVLHHEVNLGLSGARNSGIRAARGRYVTFLDDDDLLARDRLAIGCEGLDLAKVAICFRGNHPGGRPARNRVLEGRVHDRIATQAVPHVGQACVSRDVLPLFEQDLRAGEEVDWWLRVTAELPVATVQRTGYLFRNHPGPREGNGSDVRWRSRIDVLSRHADYFAAHPDAAAFQWKRVGLLAEEAGDRAMARKAFARSLRIRPERTAVWHLARTVMPARAHVGERV
jgi:glycosyltransferase involved in cell wall biosynthesis